MDCSALLTKEYLLEEYTNKKQFAKEIANKIGCAETTITRYLRKFNISEHLPKYFDILTYDFLIEEYLNKKKTFSVIALENNLTKNQVMYALVKYGFVKNKYDPNDIISKKMLLEEYVGKNKTMSQIAKEKRVSNRLISFKISKYNIKKERKYNITKKFLIENYYENNLTINKIAEKASCSTSVIYDRFRKYQIPLKQIIKGINFSSENLRKCRQYRIWRKDVLEMGNNLCFYCKKNKHLEAHHIKPLQKIVKDFLAKYAAVLDPITDKDKLLFQSKKYMPFWERTNGMVLCYDCHDKIEKGVLKLC